MNIITKRKSKNRISQSDINIISPINSLESRKVLYFQKIDSVNHINTLGPQPIIVYKKSFKNKTQIQKNSTPSSKKNSRYEKKPKTEFANKLISNANIDIKLQKFKSFSNTQKNFNKNIKISKTKSFNKNMILIEKAQKIREEMDKKKIMNEQKLFSKTVRDSNMRPVFPKNKNKQMNSTKNGFNVNQNINKEDNKNNEDNEDIIAKKNMMMNQLVQNAIVIEMKKYQDYPNYFDHKKNYEYIKNNKKREYLEENGISTSNEELTINNDDNDNDKIINNSEKNKKRNTDTSFHPKINNYFIQDNIPKNIFPISPKTKIKPEIEQFEYIIKINEEKKKLISEMRNIYKQNQVNIIKNDDNVKKNNFVSPKIYPSFRTKNKQNYEENKSSNDSILNSNSFFLKDKKNHRSTREINQYLKEKKMKNKQIEENKQIEKNKKLFMRFKNLYNLNMKDNNYLNKEINSDTIYNQYNSKNQKNIKKVDIEERKDEFIEPEENLNEDILDNNIDFNKNLNSNNNIRKRKELNEYYIGNDSTIRNNNSTLVDVNEYYLNILESQQLLVNSKLKKIEDENNDTNNENQNENNQNLNNEENNEINIINENNKNINNINNINNLNLIKNNLKLDENELESINLSKEQIKKITEKELTKTSNTKNITEEILNTSSIEELKLKINNTLQRANIFLSKQNITTTNNNNLTNNTNSNIQNNININTNNEANKEKENIPKKEININEINNHKDNINNIEEEKNNIISEEISSIESKKIPEKKLDSRLVLNLIEVIKFIIQRKTFVILYESYINHAIYQQYNIAFSYLVAICKQYPFKKLEEYYNYKTYNYAFRQLLRPFNRYNFKYFISCFQMRKKVEYLNMLLTKMIKFKTLEKIYLYGQYIQEDDEEKAFKIIIMKIMNTLIRPHLWEAFCLFKEKLYLDDNEEPEDLNSELSYDNDKGKNEFKDDKEENEVNFNISDDDEFLSAKSYDNNNKLNMDNIKEKKSNNKNFNLNEIINSEKNKEETSQSIDNKKQSQNESMENDNNNKDNINNSNVNENNNINNQRRKNDSSLKMNSYIYESLDSSQKSSLNIEPNSLDNDRLHKLKLILLEKNKNFENDLEDNYNIDEIYMGNSSKKSDKSLQELMNIKMGKNGSKTLSDMMEENSLQKSPEDISNIDNLKKTLRSQISESKTEKLKDEGTKVINETKDTKEITDDSNTFNLNTNNKSDNDKNSKHVYDTSSNSEINKNNNLQNIKINNIQKKIEYDEDEDINNIKEIIEETKEINHIIDDNDIDEIHNKKNIKILKNYKIIEKTEKLQNLITDEEKTKTEEDIMPTSENKKIKIPLIKIINDSNDSSSENKNSNSKEEIKSKNKLSNIFENPSQFTDNLVNEIINSILFSEIKSSKIKLLPNKKYKFDKLIKNSSNINNNNSSQSNNSLANSCNSAGNIRDIHHSRSSSQSQISLHEDLFSLNDSLNSNYSVYSVFNKTIKDKKKEHSLNLYFNKICPKLISYLHSEIIKKYPKIYDNISTEKKNNSEKLMISLVLQDAQMLRNNYRKNINKESLEKILEKKEILQKFAKFNKQIRQEDNITSDNYYDNMLNECVLETAIELIEKERYYGESGNPLKWSSRTRDIKFKYEKNDGKKFADFICKNLLKIIHNRIGLINDNYSYLNQDEINYEREKRLLDVIKGDLNKSEYQWKNLEMEETQLKVESTEIILDQLYNEVIEILEHIQYNRISPELYQNKSIYACEEIPKLSFQQTTTEDVGMPEGDENEMMNI